MSQGLSGKFIPAAHRSPLGSVPWKPDGVVPRLSLQKEGSVWPVIIVV